MVIPLVDMTSTLMPPTSAKGERYTSFTSFEKVHTHTHPTRRSGFFFHQFRNSNLAEGGRQRHRVRQASSLRQGEGYDNSEGFPKGSKLGAKNRCSSLFQTDSELSD